MKHVQNIEKSGKLAVRIISDTAGGVPPQEPFGRLRVEIVAGVPLNDVADVIADLVKEKRRLENRIEELDDEITNMVERQD